MKAIQKDKHQISRAFIKRKKESSLKCKRNMPEQGWDLSLHYCLEPTN